MTDDQLEVLKNADGFLQGQSEAAALPVVDKSIICFLAKEPSGSNKKYQNLYDRFAPFYDLVTKAYARFRNHGERQRVSQYLNELEIKDNDRVLEISIGTGRNIKYLNARAVYYGVDISLGMLRRCNRVMKRQGREVVLVQAEAESLPFKDDSLDVVYSAGGFNFYNNRATAVKEMLRVAKPGSKLMIYDETEKTIVKFEKSKVAASIYGQQGATDPRGFLPPGIENVDYKEICSGELYVLTFRKPCCDKVQA
jgi:ubiquinone/menaquinone biosynthesis C-methylase UbiE